MSTTAHAKRTWSATATINRPIDEVFAFLADGTNDEQPTKIRWTERSKNSITVPDGGYDLEPAGDGATRMPISNAFEAHGFGKVLLPLATRAAKKDADAFAGRIKAAIEAS